MNKRVIAFLCALALLFGLLPAGVATIASAEETQYEVGYAIKDINPWVNNLTDKVFVSDLDNTDNKVLYTGLFNLTGNDNDEERPMTGLYDDNGDGDPGDGDGLFTTATAVTYNNKTVIYITIDMIQGYDKVTSDVRAKIVERLGSNVISADQIMVSASHTHSGPKLESFRPADSVTDENKTDQNLYYDHVIKQITDAAEEAYNDRDVATMSKGTVDAKEATKALGYNKDEDGVAQGYHMNAVRHYEVTMTGNKWYGEPDVKKYIIGSSDSIDEDEFKEITGYKYSYSSISKEYTPVEEADNDMHVLLFQFDEDAEDPKAPVVFVNWRAHTTMNSSVSKTLLSSDYVNGLRTTLERAGYRAAFFQGAAGNITANSREEVKNLNAEYMDWMTHEDDALGAVSNTNKTFVYGKMLASVVRYCIEKSGKMQECSAGEIRTLQMTWRGEKRPLTDIMQAAYNEIETKIADGETIDYPYVYKEKTETGTGNTYIVNSPIHKSAIKDRITATSAYSNLELNAILLGDQVAFVTAPNELVDKYYNYEINGVSDYSGDLNDWNNLIDDTYGTPFVLGYTNGRKGYIGNWLQHTANSQTYFDITGYAENGKEFFSPGTYEAFNCRLAQGQGEKLIEQYGKMLNLLQDSARVAWCEACKDTVEWNPVTSGFAFNNTNEADHYYFVDDIADTGMDGQWAIGDGTNAQTICIDLMGHTKTSEFRNFRVKGNATLNLMDSVGGAEVQGQIYSDGTNSNSSGGNVYVEEGGTFQLYGGTLSMKNDEAAGRGGVAYVSGTMNMYGGTIKGAKMATSDAVTSNNGCGGAIYVATYAHLNAYGGTIKSGSVPDTANGPCVFINGRLSYVILGGDANVENIYFYNNDGSNFTVSGAYTGQASLTFYQINSKTDSTTIKDGADIGNGTENPSLAGENITWTTSSSSSVQAGGSVYIDNGNLRLSQHTTGTSAILCDSNGTKAYDALSDAITDCSDNGYVKLAKDVSGTVTINKNVTIDLNGFNMSDVEVKNDCTLYGMDSKTDDYAIEGSKGNYSGFGKIANKTGDGTVAAVPVEDACAEDGYLMVSDDANNKNQNISFHRVKLQVYVMTLRSIVNGEAQPSIYYQSYFKGDQIVAQEVDNFGVALGVYEMPNAVNMDTKCKYSKFTNFISGKDGNESGTSTLLKGVMKVTNSESINKRNANMDIYGRAYVKLNDGSYLFGKGVSRSLKEQIEETDKLWNKLNDDQMNGYKTVYETYRSVMKNWDIPNAIAQHADEYTDDGVLKILGIGNSYTNDSMQMLNAVYQAEKPGEKLELGVAYYSGCSLDKHVRFYNEKAAVYVYYYLDSETGKWNKKENVTLQEIIQANNWDYVSMQQGSGQSGVASSYNKDIQTIQGFVDDELGYTPTFFWNMTWAYPETDPTSKYLLGNNYVSGGAKAPNAASFEDYYNNSQETMYQKIVETVQAKIVPDDTFKWIMPVGTAIQNAQSSYLTDLDLYRDYTHMNDFGRLMAAYVWYGRLENTTPTFALTSVPEGLEKADPVNNWNWSEDMIDVLKESVTNALATPFAVTLSAITE